MNSRKSVITLLMRKLNLPVTYLFRTTGQVIGVSLSGAVLQAVLLKALKARITGPNAAELIESIRYVRQSVELFP